MRFNTLNPNDFEESMQGPELELKIEIELTEPNMEIVAENPELIDDLKESEYQDEGKQQFTQEDLQKMYPTKIP